MKQKHTGLYSNVAKMFQPYGSGYRYRLISPVAFCSVSRIGALCFLAGTLLFGCSSPEINGTQWHCEDQSDCVDGYVCNAFSGGICEPALKNEDGVFDDKIVIGTSLDLTSQFASTGGNGLKNGMNAYFNRINSVGGVHGRKLELVAKDDQFNAEMAADNVLEMVDGKDRQVFAIMGNLGTHTMMAALPALTDRRILLFAPQSGTPSLRTNDRYVFNLRVGYDAQTNLITEYYLKNRAEGKINYKNIFFVGQAQSGKADTHSFESLDGFGSAAFEGVAKALRDEYEVAQQDVPLSVVEVGSSEVSDAAERFLKWMASDDRVAISDSDSDVEIVCIMQLTIPPGVAFMTAVRDAIAAAKNAADETNPLEQYNLTLDQVAALKKVSHLYISHVVADNEVLAELAAKSTDYCTDFLVPAVVPNVDSGLSATVEFKDAMAAYDENLVPNLFSLEGYLAAKLLVKGLDAAGRDLTTETLIDALEGLNGDAADLGLGVPTGFSSNSHDALEDIWVQSAKPSSSTANACVYEQLDID